MRKERWSNYGKKKYTLDSIDLQRIQKYIQIHLVKLTKQYNIFRMIKTLWLYDLDARSEVKDKLK